MLSREKTYHLVHLLVNRQLFPHQVNYEYVRDNPKINGLAWYEYYTMSQVDADEFKTWAMGIMREKYKMKKREVENFFAEFWLMWGLKVE